MMTKLKLALLSVLAGILLLAVPASACGGLFCTTIPVFQEGERIIFTQNGDGTTSAIIQINYTGNPDEFSWILPVKSAINVSSDVSLPEDGMDMLDEIDRLTIPQYIAPSIFDAGGDCALMPVAMNTAFPESVADGDVEVISQGIVGNYDISVVGSTNPDELITWLNDNSYVVTADMEPLISVYVDDGFNFLAMKLIAGSDSQDIVPLQMKYEGEQPMIPLKMTPVGANPGMQVLAFMFAEAQAKPSNFEHIVVDDSEITFSMFGGSDYQNVLNARVDEHNGLAFVTEYAQPTGQITFTHPLLKGMAEDYAYLTRLNTFMDPEEMTADPMFEYDSTLEDVNNIHDFTQTHEWVCDSETFDAEIRPLAASSVPTNVLNTLQNISTSNLFTPILIGIGIVMLASAAYITRRNS